MQNRGRYRLPTCDNNLLNICERVNEDRLAVGHLLDEGATSFE